MILLVIVAWVVATLLFAYSAFKQGYRLGYYERGVNMKLPEQAAKRYRDTEPRWRQ